jgi:Fe(II)/alpha-ketoglutarate-dependent arginine beta-hydroxylase
MYRIDLSPEEVESIRSLADELASRYSSVEDEVFLTDAVLYAHEAPRRLRKFLNDFKLLEPPTGVCLISGYPVDGSKIGPTPLHWEYRSEVSPALEEEMVLALCGFLLGDLIGWGTQQNGYMVHEVLPIKEFEDLQVNFSSKQYITWHTEDAFHPYRGDYLGLMCLRNPDRVATTYASIAMLEVDRDVAEALFEPHFMIHPDESHSERHRPSIDRGPAGSTRSESAYEMINRLHNSPEKVPVLFGHRDSPYMRLDPYVMDPPDNDRAIAAFHGFTSAIDDRLSEVVLEDGDILFIDNYRVVHGRRPFAARYDGTDRWLKRINVARDLRKSRDARASCASRVIF